MALYGQQSTYGGMDNTDPGLTLPSTETSSGSTGFGDNQTAGIVGAGVSAAADTVGGILSGVQTKRLREQSEAESMAEIAQARIEREKELDLIKQQDSFAKQQARTQNLLQDVGLRLQMFQRNMQKEAQKYQDVSQAISRIRKNAANTDVIKDIFARNIGRV